MIKAVFFDAIDTLFCAYPNKVEMYRRIIKQHTGLEISTEQMTKVWDKVFEETEVEAEREIHFHKKQLAWKNFNERMLKVLGYEGNAEEKGEELRIESWSNPENFILYPDVLETLKKLKKENLFVSCVSNESRGLYKFFIHFGIKCFFDSLTISEVEKCEKPGPEIFIKAMKKLNLKPEEVIFVGDSVISDYEGALNVGMNAVLIDREGKIKDTKINKINRLTEVLSIVEGENNYARTTA